MGATGTAGAFAPLPKTTMAKTAEGKTVGKKHVQKLALITKPSYDITEACELLPQLSTTKFDGTAEVHVRINADTTQADQLVRTTVVLPHGTGKKVRIAAFVPDDLIADAKKAGAVLAGKEDLIKQIESGKIDFDVAVAVPEVMKDLGKIAKTLGQKGLMPNPKSGTVGPNVVKIIEEVSRGRVECKMDKLGIIHTVFGKMSFGPKKLEENLQALMNAIKEAQPAGIKATYILSVTITPTMGPGVKVKV